MATPSSQKGPHALSVIHMVAVLALACWWGAYFWLHSPSRHLFQEASSGAHAPSGRRAPLDGMASRIDQKFAAAARAVEAGMIDLAFGALVVAFLAVGTGVYIRRFEIWLSARSSGQAVALGSSELSDAALAANVEAGRFVK